MSKVYKPQRLGSSTYLCIPPSFFSSGMLERGVVVELLEKHEDEGYSIIKLSEPDEEYIKGIEASGEDTQKSGLTNNIRKVD